ncbi:MAG: hypothetical protein OEZ68_10230 [Gammaproteobacteria bacterium]|nr:hypothetical protein [Gammaproteobacteria bacterium]MDH5801167.1 hypothetical protein [Gammaproteobacteria bacterium]
MSFSDLQIGSSPVVSGIVWFFLLTLFLYMARDAAHKTILSLCRILRNGFRMSARTLVPLEHKVALRNKEVLLAAGREAKERELEREFERISAAVKKELADTPTLNRRVLEEITKLEDDYKLSAEVPPPPPGWVNAVDAVAKIPAKSDPIVADILEDIHGSLVKAHNNTTEEYRNSRKERHQLLKNMVPSWRKMLEVVNTADKNVTALLERAKIIDRYMDDYEQIINGTDRAVRELSESSFKHFFTSTFVLLIAVGGAMINFSLIARPMAEMVGGNTYIMDYKVANIAAMVIILVEITMGLFLMECMRITRLFPAIGSLKDYIRVKMIWFTFTILLSLAFVEAGLAYMRELLVQDELATSALLRGGAAEAVDNGYLWITTVAQMGMGFVLPFALTFVAIPLETFVSSLRSVMGGVTVALIRVGAFGLRITGNGFLHLGNLMVHLFDLLVFMPLWLEKMVKNKPRPVAASGPRQRKLEQAVMKEAS